MSAHSVPFPTVHTSAVRNTVGKEKETSQRDPNGPASDAALREFCDKNYNQLLPILAEKMHQEKVQQEKLKAVKARLNFEEISQYAESGTLSRSRDIRKRLGPKAVRSVSGSPKPRRGRSESPRKRDPERKTVFKRLENGVFRRLGTELLSKRHHNRRTSSRKGGKLSESEDSAGGHWKSKSKKQKSSIEDDDLSQPWICEGTDPFTPRIRCFDLPKRTRMPSHVKTYDESEDPEDHLKIFQATAKVERWAMPTWCHMFNSILTGSARVWFDDLPPESIDSYDDLKEAFLANYLQQKKCIKDLVEIHHIKQRKGESTEDFVQRFKVESRDVKGASKVMRISGFMYGITNPELIKRLHDKILKSVDEMMRITTSFLRGELAVGNQERKKSLPHDATVRMDIMQKTSRNEVLKVNKGLSGGRTDILYEQLLQQTPLGNKKSNGSRHYPLIGFNGEIIWPLGKISLLVKIGDEEHSTSAWMNFVIVRSSSPYNEIIGRLGIRKIQAVPSTTHGMLKFPVVGGILTLRSSKIIPIKCAAVSKVEGQPLAISQAVEERIKDCYPLLEIDWKVESLCGFPFKCFLDAYKVTTKSRWQKKMRRRQHSSQVKEYFATPRSAWKVKSSETWKKRQKMYIWGRGRNVLRVQSQYQRNKGMPGQSRRGSKSSIPKMFEGCAKAKWKVGKLKQNEEAESAFKQMKQHIAKLPMLTAPEEKEELIVYLAAAKEAVSAVLMTEREAKQIPIYFVSHTLRGPEINYTSMEKLVLALVHASKRLKRYFQAHPIIVVMDQPIKQVLSKPEIAGRLQKWSIELGEYAIHYRPRVSVKGQILADFIVERPEEDSPIEVEEELPEPWILFTDGSSCADGSGAGLILTNPEGMEFTYALRFRIAKQMGVKNLQANVDSLLVANQVNETYIAKEAGMIQYLEKVKTLTNGFRMFSIKQVPRSENKKADALSKIASTSFAYLSKQVLVEELKEKSINEIEVLAVVEEEGNTWMTPIQEYLMEEILPIEANKARAVRWAASSKLCSKRDTRRVLQHVHRPIPRNPQQKLTPITSPWPFYKWGIDIAGPFSEGPGKVKFLIVAIDYFTKFGLLGEIISDNEKQFRDNPFKDWCEKLCIRQCFASVKHPQANGLVKRANRSLGEGIKARLDARSKD
ncbi:reverse transcriptase domain-containing protein [Tanacetum coccineum]